tara:strand:- start:524 stop:781 length:258 start_codon:yes stop_codon:yes gene_type:complete
MEKRVKELEKIVKDLQKKVNDLEKNSGKSARKKKSGPKKSPTPYNLFMKKTLAELKKKHPEKDHMSRFKMVGPLWKKKQEESKKK